MRHVIALVVLGGLGLLYMHGDRTAASADKVFGKAETMARRAGPEAAEIGYRVVADRYPFSEQARSARERLHALRAETLVHEADLAPAGLFWGDGVLRDRFWSKGDPYVSASTLALLGLVLAFYLLTMRRSRVRGAAFLLFVGLAAAWLGTQTELGMAFALRTSPDVARSLYALFPWAAAVATSLVGLLMLVRKRRPSTWAGRRVQRA